MDDVGDDVIFQLRNVRSELPEMMLRAYGRENMSASEIAQLNMQAVIRKWQRNPLDTGSGEVQVAVFTEKMRRLSEHMERHKKDMNTKRRLLMIVHQRNRMLRYMRRRQRDRYHQAVEGLSIRVTKNFDPTIMTHAHATKSWANRGGAGNYKPKKRKKRAAAYGEEKSSKGRTRLRQHAVRQQRLQRERAAAATAVARQEAIAQAQRQRDAAAAASSTAQA